MRRLIPFLTLCALLALASGSPARARDAAEDIARAQETLAQIARLLDAIQARQAASPRASGPQRTAAGDGWQSLFDGETLGGWTRTDFAGGGAVHVEKSFRGGPAAIVVDAGSTLSGINWTGETPKTNYEIALDAMKIEGGDFMCGLTFPVADSHATLILGGWGGTVVGISSLDNHDASENETTKFIPFPANRWYAVRLRVTPARLEAWLDTQKIVDQDITGRKISLRFGEISKSVPLGLATYQTSAAYRAIRLRRLDASPR